MDHRFRGAASSAVAISLALSTVAKADPGSADESRLDVIVVTAERSRESALQETPIAVTALSVERLQQKNIVSLQDIAAFVPGLSIGSRAGTGAADGNIAIRGMGVDAQDSQASVGIYVDDVFFAGRQGNLLGLLDPERVEVLRGPQGTLFGRNTLAGAIQYVTKAPSTDGFEGYVRGTLGSFNRTDAEGAVNVPLGEDFAVRAAGLYTSRDGYIRDLLNDVNRGSEKTYAGRLRLRWEPGDDLTVDLKGEIVRQENNGRAVLVSAVNPNAQFAGIAGLFGTDLSLFPSFISADRNSFGGFNQPDFFEFDFWSLQGNIGWDITDTLRVKSITSYSSYRPLQAQDLDNTPLDILALVPAVDDSASFTQEFQLSGSAMDDRLDFTVGAYYFNFDQTKNPNLLTKVGPFPPVDAFGNPRNRIESLAFYGRSGFKITDALSVDVGLRYTSERTSSELIDETAALKRTFTDWSPHIGVNYRVSDEAFLYAKASKGFRAGGFTANRELPGGGNAFDPETAWTYEGGLRLELPWAGIRFNPTLYWTDWKDIQFNQLVVGVTGNPAVTTQNAGDARIRGLELETLWSPIEGLEFSANLSLLDAEYTRVEDIFISTFPAGWQLVPTGAPPPFPPVAPAPVTVVPLRNITLDHPLQRAPELAFTIGARYEHQLANGASVAGTVSYAWTDEQGSAVTVADQVTLPAYGLLNARIQYTAPDKRWSAALFGTNLSNSSWLIGGIGFDTGYTVGPRELDPGRPRELGFEVRVNF